MFVSCQNLKKTKNVGATGFTAQVNPVYPCLLSSSVCGYGRLCCESCDESVLVVSTNKTYGGDLCSLTSFQILAVYWKDCSSCQ